ncbi:variable surface protein [Plasmodium gonderi]|uniref:Variable surface protein n=1 Tax=Plasmodium gonderi TaxID=77519 RepID=A0A1Y1JBG2_PLAGO|nr:variable surface protein [Plasmodium gonderi]GAW79590.1 variable surface protein [Plasmodium gonderi]
MFINGCEKLLPELPSYIKYHELDNVLVGNEDESFCNDLATDNEEVKTHCKRIATNLRALSKSVGSERTDNCYYFQNWFFEHLWKKINTQGEIYNQNVVKKLYAVVEMINRTDFRQIPCTCIQTYNLKEAMEEKDLHDYFKNYNYIITNMSDKNKCENYINYINYIENLYNEDQDYCCGLGYLYQDCIHYFKCEEHYRPSNLLSKLRETISQLNENTTDVGIGAKSEVHNETGSPHQSDIMPPKRSEDENLFPEITYNTPLHGTIDTADTIPPISDTLKPINYQQIVIGTSIMGTIIFLYFFYKSTLFESRPNKRRIKKKRFNNYYHENLNEESLEHDFDSEFEDSQMRRLYFVYNPR